MKFTSTVLALMLVLTIAWSLPGATEDLGNGFFEH